MNTEIRRLLDELRDLAGEAEISAKVEEFLALPVEDLVAAREEIVAQLDDAKLGAAAVTAKLALGHLALSTPFELPDVGGVHAKSGPAGERLVAALLLLQHAHETVPLDEQTVARSLDHLRQPDFGSYGEVFAGAVSLLRTAAYYVIDARDAFDALASDPPEQESFPPLPFPRVWIESRSEGHDAPTPYLRFVDENGERPDRYRTLDVLGVGLVEVERGLVWDIYIAFKFVGDIAFFLAERIGPDGVIAADPDAETLAGAAFRAIRRLAVGGTHLIVAKNVPHEEIVLPRHQRKRIKRTFAQSPPRLYYVNLGASGERGEASGSGREYHVRWLVRGHWRNYREGTSEKGRVYRGGRTWIDPYVKGPPDAPWKGRAVRR